MRISLSLFALSPLALAAAAVVAQQPHPVLMISIDGMRPDYVTHADEHGLKIPNLRALVQSGTYADGVTASFPTVTYPNHTTLVTGVWPAQHGIVNNQLFDPEHKFAGAWYWYADAIRVPTLWSQAHHAGLTTASVGWPVTVDSADIDYLLPEYWRGNLGESTNPDDRLLLNSVSRPLDELKRIAARTGTPYMTGNPTDAAADEIKTVYSLDILRQHKPVFMTIHLSSLDEEQHLHGPFSAEANADIELLDGMVGRLTAQVRANDPASVVVIVSDHGFADIDRAVRLSVPFVAAGLMPAKPGAPDGLSAWQAEPWPLGCMYAIMLRHPEDAALKAKVRTLLDQFAAQPENGVEAVLDAKEVVARGGVPEATFVVTLRKGFVPSPDTAGPLVSVIPGHRGTHGYDPNTTPEMRSSFFASGKGIAAGRDLGVIDMRSIAPSLARLLGVSLPQAAQPALPLQ